MKTDFIPNRKAIIKRKIKEDMLSSKEVNEKINLEIGNEDRIVCRCEQVSEKTILDALRRGIKVTTIDGVKRSTRIVTGKQIGRAHV